MPSRNNESTNDMAWRKYSFRIKEWEFNEPVDNLTFLMPGLQNPDIMYWVHIDFVGINRFSFFSVSYKVGPLSWSSFSHFLSSILQALSSAIPPTLLTSLPQEVITWEDRSFQASLSAKELRRDLSDDWQCHDTDTLRYFLQ